MDYLHIGELVENNTFAGSSTLFCCRSTGVSESWAISRDTLEIPVGGPLVRTAIRPPDGFINAIA